MPQEAELLRAYLVVGPDELKRETAVKRLKGRLNSDLSDFNLDERMSAAEITEDELLSTLNTMPFGDAYRLVIIHEAGKLAKASSETIVSYLDNPNPSCVLLLETESLANNTRLYKAVAAQGAQAVIDCSSIKRWQLPKHVSDMARAKGFAMNQDAADELINRTGESTIAISNQLDALLELFGQGSTVSLDDVRSYVAQTAELKPWGLLDELSKRNVGSALEMYNKMPEGSEISLLSLINGRVRELICAKSLDEEGVGFSLAQALGRQDWQVKNHLTWASAFKPGELEELLAQGAECEYALKSSKDSKTAFIEFLLAFAA